MPEAWFWGGSAWTGWRGARSELGRSVGACRPTDRSFWPKLTGTSCETSRRPGHTIMGLTQLVSAGPRLLEDVWYPTACWWREPVLSRFLRVQVTDCCSSPSGALQRHTHTQRPHVSSAVHKTLCLARSTSLHSWRIGVTFSNFREARISTGMCTQ